MRTEQQVYDSLKAKFKHDLLLYSEEHKPLDAIDLAITSILVEASRSIIANDNAHAFQLELRNKQIRDLKEQNKRQADMLEKFMC